MKNKYAGSAWNEVRQHLLTPKARKESKAQAILIAKIIKRKEEQALLGNIKILENKLI